MASLRIRFSLRRLFVLVAVLALPLGYWALVRSVNRLRVRSEQIIGKHEKKTIRLITSSTGTIMSQPVWQVYVGHDSDPVLTVQHVFQESVPGAPILDTTTKNFVLHDEENSYAFDLTTGAFLHNQFPDVVYSGPYRPR